MSSHESVPVRAVCAMFGLNPNTLRTWERRYGFPIPARGDGGQRGYSPEDVAAIGKVVALVKSGMAPAEAVANAQGNKSKRTPREAPVFDARLLAAVRGMEYVKVRATARKTLKRLGYARFVEEFAFPALDRLGHEWEANGKGVAAEHAFSLVVEGMIREHGLQIDPRPHAPGVTFACAPGENHTLALLHLANLASERGVATPLVLAAGLPIEETVAASRKHKSKLIVLSATVSPAAADTRAWIDACIAAGWSDRVILCGPGFLRSRVFMEYTVRAAAGGFDQTLDLLQQLLAEYA